jgi:hypothetical protein
LISDKFGRLIAGPPGLLYPLASEFSTFSTRGETKARAAANAPSISKLEVSSKWPGMVS